MMTFVATACLGLASCGGDDSDEPAPTPDTGDKVVTGNTALEHSVWLIYSESYGDGVFLWVPKDNPTTVFVYSLDKLYTSSKIVYVGIVSDLKSIKQAPTTGWADKAELVNGGGYVVSYECGGLPYYVRIVLKENRDVTGTLVGVNYSFQHFKPSNI